MMKHILNQVMSAVGALLCVLLFWVSSSNEAALLLFIMAPAVIGVYLGFRIGLHGLTLPLFSFAMMLVLANARIYPFYSTDWHWDGPSMLYTMFLAPSVILPLLIVVIIRAIQRRRNGSSQALESSV